MIWGTGWAQFWAADLHVHTPASEDAAEEDFGEPSQVVQAAIDAGLDVIAITDHNTADWCDRMAEAAEGTALVVLPGVEISTPDGHLLGIWEERTDAKAIEEVLVELGITRAVRGRLDALTSVPMLTAAERINASGGVAIAAHIEKERGILNLPVQTHVNAILRSAELSALEFVHSDTQQRVADKVRPDAPPAMVRSSDCWSVKDSRHALTGIGRRRTWIKAGRPDLCGLRHALDDPDLRVRLTDPADREIHPVITRVALTGGFLSGTSLELSPDLNCLLGGTGAGKSLVLEAIRFVLGQQVDGRLFKHVRDEVDRRLQFALGAGAQVIVEVRTSGECYKFVRTYGTEPASRSSYQQVAGDWVEVEVDAAEVLPIAAFSQGEILEYARQPVGRVGLIDAHLDLVEVEQRIEVAEGALEANSRRLLSARSSINELSQEAAKEPELAEQVRKLADVFDTEAVKRQGDWTKEQSALSGVQRTLEALSLPDLSPPGDVHATLPEHESMFAEVNGALEVLRAESTAALEQLADSMTRAKTSAAAVRDRWQAEFSEFKGQLDKQLEEASGGTSLSALRAQLEGLQTRLDGATAAKKQLTDVMQPELDTASVEREELLSALQDARTERRSLRRQRVSELNRKTANFVKLDIPRNGDTSRFREALDMIKVGSRVREEVLDAISNTIHPFRFVRALWDGDVAALVDVSSGISAADVGRLLANIDDRNLWPMLLDMQKIENPDVLDVKFRKPDDGSLASIESLSHGQKCTAVLVILLADGDSPVLVDQPEDALHAPWIEEYLVDRLRELRGTRQYIFATRSPGLVVSADAEQIVTMKATAGRGDAEASGSLERHDLNELALHHLEGGKIPFARRTRKLSASISG